MRYIALVIGLITLPSVVVAKNKSEPSAIKGNPGIWFPQNSYPAAAKRNGEQGRVTVELAIDNTGVPVACTLVSSSGSASLDAATCDLALANARFIPAKDARGRPIASRYTLPAVRWELNDDYLRLDLSAGPVSTTMRNVEILVDEKGKTVSCRSLASNAGGNTGCENFRPGAGIVRPLFLDGKPVAGKVTITTTMRIEPK
jgi:TonB family protein